MIFKKTIFILLTLLLVFTLPIIAGEIHKAAKDGDFETVKKLLEEDPNLLNTGNRLQQTPLLLASFGGYTDIVLFLIEKGAKIDQPDSFGATPLHMAVLGGQPEIVELLISKGADVNIKSRNGKIPLQMAFEKDAPDIVEIFIKQGMAINSNIDQYGRTMLHEAAILGKIKIASFLIDKGAVIDAKDNAGKSPLDYALTCDHQKVAELLISKGATPLETPSMEVVYIANAGFFISCGKSKILIDSLFRDGFGRYPVPEKEVLESMLKGEPPYNNADLLLVTFKQAAHFDPHLIETYLANNPKTVFLAPRQVGLDLELFGSQFQKIKPQVVTITPPLNSYAEVTIKGMKVKILRLNYSGDFQNLGYIVKLEGKTLFFPGDAVLKNNEDTIKKLGLSQLGIDVLFISYWDFLNGEARAIIHEYIQPKHIAVMHIPPAEADDISKDIQKLENEYPNVTIFRKNMAKWMYK
ncbi:MAG: ankyrin repeat domain-containing protein [Candidatus Aminicenantes bacterium]